VLWEPYSCAPAGRALAKIPKASKRESESSAILELMSWEKRFILVELASLVPALRHGTFSVPRRMK
jgi:hypothetical protein